MPGEHARGLAAIGRAEDADGFGDIAVDRPRCDAEIGRDLLRFAQRRDTAQHVAVAVRQPVDAGFVHVIPLSSGP